MKKTITSITAIFLIAIAGANAQSTLRPGSNTNPPKSSNFFEIRDAMNKYFYAHPEEMRKADEDSPEEISDGAYEKFKRWENYWESRVTATGEFVSPLVNVNEWKAYNDRLSSMKESDMKDVATANWIAKGPDNTPGGVLWDWSYQLHCFSSNQFKYILGWYSSRWTMENNEWRFNMDCFHNKWSGIGSY
ncbi:MAG: hypothetical protein NTV09_11005 [Bacteroidetes bacterium]|nr:hypothetical protein [Bacteroidota bacterium]